MLYWIWENEHGLSLRVSACVHYQTSINSDVLEALWRLTLKSFFIESEKMNMALSLMASECGLISFQKEGFLLSLIESKVLIILSLPFIVALPLQWELW